MALGRGLSELLGEVEIAYEKSSTKKQDGVLEIDVDTITPNPNQPRKIFDEEKLQELSDSIKQHGLLQPIVVMLNSDGTYTLVAGERRLRATKLAGKGKIKAVISNIDETKLRELALIENIQRDNLNVIELAYSYAQLLNEHKLTHEDLATKVSKSRSSITNTIRLLTLSVHVQQLLGSDKISAGHAKVLIGLDKETQNIVADSIIGQKLSVRETEKLVNELKNPKKEKQEKTKEYNIDLKPLEDIANLLKEESLKVKLDKNFIKIEFENQAQIEQILKYFSKT
ncbi:MAG: ParB/RepB/Spo0J family partition protein [Arcobacter butzleri]|jgi:ParB family chromosome partitioning protein|nr:ParB/RepB/Spo0J family partition protein [Arcobacteraceae bacterium]MDY0364772.1 ParB/RepB/Spo0J family partition protein [Arcobacteraceae bacterium]NLO17714.1 ParB/RepB/Spo0J family partition protein [Aliarcobacter butzleri]